MAASPAIMAASPGSATADLDGNGSNTDGFTDKGIDVDNGTDESGAKQNAFNVWDD